MFQLIHRPMTLKKINIFEYPLGEGVIIKSTLCTLS